MSGISYSQPRNRWRVRWFPAEGKRDRWFRTEQEARDFAATLGEPINRPTHQAQPLTPENLRATIKARTVIDENGCWIWTARGGSNGYAQMTRRVDGKVTAFSMHRVSYEVFVGPIPDGLTLDHLCEVTKCVNPEHLEPVSRGENARRYYARRAEAAS